MASDISGMESTWSKIQEIRIDRPDSPNKQTSEKALVKRQSILVEVPIKNKFRAIIQVKGRRHWFKYYENCFIGEEAVQAMIENGLAKNVSEAVKLGNELFNEGVFSHVCNDHSFKNEHLFYRFANDFPQYLRQVTDDLYYIRGSFKILGGLFDFGAHMMLIRRKNGNFVMVSTCEVDKRTKKQVDALTDNGLLLEAVIGTHPFHTLSFPYWHKQYPKVPFYGTSRHLRNQPEIFEGRSIFDKKNQKLFAPELEFKVCGKNAGVEIDDPKPPSRNHIASVFVFHPSSRSLLVDDTVCYYSEPGFLLRMGIKVKKDELTFHDSFKTFGITGDPKDPLKFKAFIEEVIKDWDVEHLLCSHTDPLFGNAKERLKQLLKESEPQFQELIEVRKNKIRQNFNEEQSKSYREGTNDCG